MPEDMRTLHDFWRSGDRAVSGQQLAAIKAAVQNLATVYGRLPEWGDFSGKWDHFMQCLQFLC